MNKLRSISYFFVVGLLIIFTTNPLWGQDSTATYPKKRIYRIDSTMNSKVTYSCTDSIVANLQTNKISMYGDAKVVREDVTLTADLIEMDMETNEVYAIYTLDKDSNRVGIPKFESGTQSFTAASIRYNFETEKGYIEELKTQQNEMYLHMGVAKRQADGDIDFIKGKFTTCSLDEPHFHFQLSRAVMVPEKRIATGPMNLWVMGIPTPIALPSSVIPIQKKEVSGFLFPMIVPVSPFGFGFQNLGYYFPIKNNDHIQTTFYASLYAQGTFEIKNQTDYKKRYKYDGTVNLAFSSFRRPFPQDSIRNQKIVVQWMHRQKANANPYWQFNAKVNFQSDNTGKTSLDPLGNQYYQNNFNSDINLVRKFPGKPVTMGLKMGIDQNSASKQINVHLPTLNINVNRFFPFKNIGKDKIGKERFYEKIGLVYSLEARNSSLFADSLLSQQRFDLISQQFLNGIRQNIGLSYPLRLFNHTVTLNTTANYNMRMNFQSIDKRYDTSLSQIVNDTLRGFGFSHDVAFQTELSTSLYSYYKFVGGNGMKMRHVATPRIAFRFQPDISSYVTEYLGPTNTEVHYSPFENSLYREAFGRQVGLISYSLNNTFELKYKNRSDTTSEDAFVRKRIIDALSINGTYDIFKDSLQFSDINIGLRFSPLKGLSIVSQAYISPYAWDKDGNTLSIFASQNGQGIGRMTRANISTTYTFAASKSRDKIKKNQELMGNYWGADFHYYAMFPQEIIDFDIPWKINLTHTFFVNINTSPTAEKRYNTNQNIMLSGDFSFTKRWKLGLTSSYSFDQQKLTQTRLSLTRDMHCWQLSFFWTPVGGQQSFLVRFNATAALLQSAKLEVRKPPDFL